MTPSQSALAALPDEGMSIYKQAQAYLLQIDEQIDRLDKILARLQPPLSGRVRVAWRKSGDKRSAECRPVLVRWRKQGEFWRSEKLGLKSLVQKVPKTGSFYNTREEVRVAVRELSILLNKRSAVVDVIGQFERSIGIFCEAGQKVIREAIERTDDLEKRAALLPCTWRDGAMEEPPPGKLSIKLEEMPDEERAALIAMIDAASSQ